MKTNACRILDQQSRPYELIEYEWREEELDAASVARKIALPPSQIFKTLVLTGSMLKYFVMVIPGDKELNLKAAARLTGNKSCSMLPVRDLLDVTGYQRGGCSPIGMKKKFPTFIDRRALSFERISISAGTRGAQLLLAPHELARSVDGQFVSLSDS